MRIVWLLIFRLLWKSLSHIRKLSAQGSDSAVFNRTQVNCSRPHVFQQRWVDTSHLLSESLQTAPDLELRSHCVPCQRCSACNLFPHSSWVFLTQFLNKWIQYIHCHSKIWGIWNKSFMPTKTAFICYIYTGKTVILWNIILR